MNCNLIRLYDDLYNIVISFPIIDNHMRMLTDLSLNDKLKETSSYSYPDSKTLDDISLLLNSTNYTNMTIPFEFLNSTYTEDINLTQNNTINQNYGLSKILKIASGTAIIGGVLLTLIKFVRRIPTFGLRVNLNTIVSTRTQQLQRSTVNIERILSEYQKSLYTSLIGTYTTVATQQENTSIKLQIKELQRLWSISHAENMVLRYSNNKVAVVMNNMREMQHELNIREHLIKLLRSQKRELKVKLVQNARDNYESLTLGNLINDHKKQNIQLLENQLNDARTQLLFMEQKLAEYQDDILKVHEYYKQRDAQTIGPPIIENSYKFKFDDKRSEFSNGKRWYDNIISGSIGSLLGAIGVNTYSRRNVLSLEDRLKFADTILDIQKQENIDMTNYIATTMKRAEFDSMRNSFRQNFLMKQLNEHIDENNKLKSTVVSLKKELDGRTAEYSTDIIRLNDILSTQLNESIKQTSTLKQRMKLLTDSIKDIQILTTVRDDYDGFKSFITSNGLNPIKVNTYPIIYDAMRSTYGYQITLGAPGSRIKTIQYLDLIDVLTRNGNIDNLIKVIESVNFNEFMRVVDMSNNILESVILRPYKDNPIANIKDYKDKTSSFLTHIDVFFNNQSTTVAIAGALVAAFTIGTNYRNVVSLLASLSMYIGRIVIGELKNEAIIMYKHLIIDALIWALKMVYKQGRHATSKLFLHINNVFNNKKTIMDESIPLTDPVIEHATLYIENAINGKEFYSDPVTKLPFEADANRVRSDVVSENLFDKTVDSLLDKLSVSAKTRVDYKYRGIIKTLAYDSAQLLLQ